MKTGYVTFTINARLVLQTLVIPLLPLVILDAFHHYRQHLRCFHRSTLNNLMPMYYVDLYLSIIDCSMDSNLHLTIGSHLLRMSNTRKLATLYCTWFHIWNHLIRNLNDEERRNSRNSLC